MAESSGEKTLAPTEKRLKDAAKDGDVLRSKDLAIAATTLVGAGVLKAAGPWMFFALSSGMRLGLGFDRTALEDFTPGRLIIQLCLLALPPVFILGGGIIAATIVTQLVMGGQGRFNFENILPKSQRINPGAGMSRIFGAQGWIEVGKGLLKLTLLGSIAYGWAHSRLAALGQLGAVDLAGQLGFAWSAMTSLLFALAAGLLVIGMIDWPIQWIRRRRRLRMSLQEVKDEAKESEGSPEARNARRQRQRQIAMGAIAGAMKKAQFVVTNPTHFAVAIAWDPDLAPAPVVLAKGRGEKAAAIRELAEGMELPLLEYPALARSLYYTTRERQMIREELYVAVAGVLAFVMSLKRGEDRAAPSIDVPVAVRFDAEGRPDPTGENLIDAALADAA